MEIRIERVQWPDGAGLAIHGRLDAESATELRQAVAAEIRRGEHAIAIDLSGVTFLSSAGIRVLFETQREARAAGGDCHVRTVSDPVRKVLELTRLDRILMKPAAADDGPSLPRAAAPQRPPARAVVARGVRLVDVEPPPPDPLVGRLLGEPGRIAAADHAAERERIGRESFAIGIAAVADTGAAAGSAGELVAACAAVYHRPPRPFAAVDYLLGEGDFVPEIDVITGLAWQGLPRGRARFEPDSNRPAVALDDLAACLLDESSADSLAVVVVGEVHGLVAAELIRPLAEATPADHPLAGTRAVATNWICFSREPIHAGRTAVVVGVVSRSGRGPLGGSLGPLGPAGISGHLHAVVFPHRLLHRTGGDLAAAVADLTASEPLAVVHLMADDRPVFGGGVSELVRGSCWFAPVVFAGGVA
jgi:anti-sigma B factor antagonist